MALEHESNSPLAQAVRLARSQSGFGRLIGKRQSVINDWLREERPLPAEHVLTVERELGIPRWQLRPDIYPPEEYAPSSGARPGEVPPAVSPPCPAGGTRRVGDPTRAAH